MLYEPYGTSHVRYKDLFTSNTETVEYQLEIKVLPNPPVSRTMRLIQPYLEGDLVLATHGSVPI
jgi:hypothetical protein